MCNQSRHHTALHDSFQSYESQAQSGGPSTITTGCSVSTITDITIEKTHSHEIKDDAEPTESLVCNVQIENPVLLETGQIMLKNDGSYECKASVLMDRGSMQSYLTSKMANMLDLRPISRKSMYVNGFGGHTTRKVYDVANVGVHTNEGTKYIEVIITDQIVKPIVRTGWKKCLDYKYIPKQMLADDFLDDVFKTDCLIGCDSAYLFLNTHVIKGEGPTVQFSNLGCFLSGPMRQSGLCTDTNVTTGIIAKWDTVNNDIFVNNHVPYTDKQLDYFVQESNLIQSKDEDNYGNVFIQNYVDRIKWMLLCPTNMETNLVPYPVS